MRNSVPAPSTPCQSPQRCFMIPNNQVTFASNVAPLGYGGCTIARTRESWVPHVSLLRHGKPQLSTNRI
jgi:hypothetical protein